MDTQTMVEEAPYFEILTSLEANRRELIGPNAPPLPQLTIEYLPMKLEKAAEDLDFVPLYPARDTNLLASFRVAPYTSYWATYGAGIFVAYEGPVFRYVVRQHKILARTRPLLAFKSERHEGGRALTIKGSPAIAFPPREAAPDWMPTQSSLALYWFHRGVEILFACHPSVSVEDAVAVVDSLEGSVVPPQRASRASRLPARLRRFI